MIKYTTLIRQTTNDVSNEKYCTESPEIVLIDRPLVDGFYIDKPIPPCNYVAIIFMPNDGVLFMFAEIDNLWPKVVIKEIHIIVANKQMFDATEVAYCAFVRERNIRLPYTRVMNNVPILAIS